jgi:hypothetical protein
MLKTHGALSNLPNFNLECLDNSIKTSNQLDTRRESQKTINNTRQRQAMHH